MGRRKSRSPSPSSAKPTSKKTKISSPSSVFEGNPFWKIYGSKATNAPPKDSDDNDSMVVVDGEKHGGNNNQHVDHVLDDMLRFMELSKKRNLGRDTTTANDKETKEGQEENQQQQKQQVLEKIVQSLLARMNACSNKATDQNVATTLGVFVSGEDIARLLLPWSVKGILQISHKKKTSASAIADTSVSRSMELLYWKTLNECLGFFLSSTECHEDATGKAPKEKNRNHSLNILTLSTMHKLVPVALECSLEESCENIEMDTSDNESSSLQESAKTCFCRLVDHLYRPPFDVICDTLLPVLTRECEKQSVSERSVWMGVTTSTLQLMNLRLASANPKKSFQLIVRQKIFLDLATVHRRAFLLVQDDSDEFALQKKGLQRLQNLFSALIRHGLFSSENHMDGYRSLQLAIPVFDGSSNTRVGIVKKATKATAPATKPSFRGYQEGLFEVLENFLIPSDSNDSKNATTVSYMIPLLLNIFLEQVSKMQKQHVASKSHKKNKAADKLGQLQFRFFSCLTGCIVKGLISFKGALTQIQNLDSGLRLSFFTILGDNLELLLRHNIYQPSLGNNDEREFLNQIGLAIIQSIAGRIEETNITIRFSEWKKSLRILDVLIQLNHTILHEQLAGVIARCLAFDSDGYPSQDSSRICEEASDFLVTIITIYGRLRQLDYFYLRLFDAIKELSQRNDLYRIKHHLALANDRGISIHLGRAIQESPIQQLQKIFSNVNHSIMSGSFSEDGKVSQEVAAVASDVLTKFFVGLLQNVRVDSNSFNDIYPICKDILKGSVVSLLKSGRKNSGKISKSTGNINNALMVCAWTIHLKNRCEFWIEEKKTDLSDDEENFGIPQELQQMLDDAANCIGSDSYSNDPAVLGSLKFLACQRIQQLHVECHEKQRLAYAMNAKEYSTTSHTAEAQNLVNFILQRREADQGSASEIMRQWTVLAQSITIWAPHALQNNIDSFLSQLLYSLVENDESCRRDRNKLFSHLNDSSFYEIPNISQRLGMNIASFVAENMQQIINKCDGSPDIVCSTLQTGWKDLTIEAAISIELNEKSLTCGSTDLPEVTNLLRAIVRVLDIANEVGNPIWSEAKDSSKIFQSLVQVESLCNILDISTENSFLDTKVRLVSTLRAAASRVLKTIRSETSGWEFETQKEDYMKLLAREMEISLKMINQDPSSGTLQRCISSFTMIVESLVDKYLASGTKMIFFPIEVLDSTFDQAAVERGGFHYLILTRYAAILLRKIAKVVPQSDSAAMVELHRIIRRRIWNKAQEYCFDTSKDTESLFQNESIVLIAENLRCSSIYSESQLLSLSSIEMKIVAKLRSFLTRDSDDQQSRSISYLVGCLAIAKPSRTVRQELTYQLLLANLKRSDLFSTPLCVLANGMEMDEFDEFLSKLTSNVVDVTATTVKLKILHMIVLSATSEDQISVLSNHSAIIMNNCLQIMAQGVSKQTGNDSDCILKVSSLIVDMASKKDLMVLRERDIALILARITSTINLEEEFGEIQIEEAQLMAFDACFSLVSLFLQRFSKQVHNCVPSLVISLTTMLQFVLSKSLSLDSMSSCGQKFSRLCELLLPHGDIYKKHIICLILRFVKSLRNEVHPIAKKSLLPGMYCLLDIIQEHETMQLNSMLDEECRALLRSIHEGYKKIHVYKGQ